MTSVLNSCVLFNRYVQVVENEICCENPNQDSVSVGVGDSCCGGIPFTSSGAQICCNSKYHYILIQ